MAKLTLVTILSGYYTTTQLNTNFNAIKTALDKALFRDGTAPNAMQADLDMGGWNLVNVGNIINTNAFNATNTAQLGGFNAADYTRRDAAESISAAWNFTVSPSFPAGSVLFQNQIATFTKPVRTSAVVVPTAANIPIDCALGNYFTVNIENNFTLDNPTNPPPAGVAMSLVIRVKQDGVGSRIITWGSKYKFPAGIAPVLSTGADEIDLISCTYDPANDIWMTTLLRDFS
jgi:hypothetical protein